MPRLPQVIAARGVSKRFGFQPILRGISIDFCAGDLTLLLGANGAGKSTFLRVLAGLSSPDSGAIELGGGVITGFSGHHTALYNKLSVIENLTLFAKLAARRGAGSVELLEDRLNRYLNDWGLQKVAHRPVGELSRGNQSKCSLIRALLPEPGVLLLDEPSSNLDETSTEQLRLALNGLSSRGNVVIVATHDLGRMRSIANRVVVIERGEVVADSGSCDCSDAAGPELEATIERYREANR